MKCISHPIAILKWRCFKETTLCAHVSNKQHGLVWKCSPLWILYWIQKCDQYSLWRFGAAKEAVDMPWEVIRQVYETSSKRDRVAIYETNIHIHVNNYQVLSCGGGEWKPKTVELSRQGVKIMWPIPPSFNGLWLHRKIGVKLKNPIICKHLKSAFKTPAGVNWVVRIWFVYILLPNPAGVWGEYRTDIRSGVGSAKNALSRLSALRS